MHYFNNHKIKYFISNIGYLYLKLEGSAGFNEKNSDPGCCNGKYRG